MVALVIALATAISTDAPVAPAQEQTGASRIALATISDPRNRPIVDVSADDFVIQEAGAAREILSVRPGDYPIVLVLDSGADARTDFPMIRRAASHFIDRIGQRPIAVVTIGGTPQLVASFETERAELVAKIETLDAATNAPTALLEGIALAARVAGEMMIEYLVPVGSKPSDVKVGVRIAGARVHGLGVAPR